MTSIEWGAARVFHGDLTSQAAKVYAQLPAGVLEPDQELLGEVHGPFCAGTRTLPARMSLRYLGADPAPLATALIPDPSIWLPELPATYRVHLRVVQQGRTLSETEMPLGLRWFAAQRRSFLENGQRVVVRGGVPDAENPRDAQAYRDARLHQVLHEEAVSDALLQEADEAGVPLVVVASADADFPATLRRMARHAAVSLVLAPESLVEQLSLDEALFQAACRNRGGLAVAAMTERPLPKPWTPPSCKLFAATAHRSDAAWDAAPWPQIVLGRQARDPSCGDPVIGVRRACECLQRDNASRGDFAGYLAGL